jgi:hypothetical protein
MLLLIQVLGLRVEGLITIVDKQVWVRGIVKPSLRSHDIPEPLLAAKIARRLLIVVVPLRMRLPS